MASNQTIASMSVRISATTQELQAGLNSASKEIKNFGDNLGDLGKLAVGAFAIDRIAEFGKEIITAGANAEGVKNAFENLNEPGLLENLRKATKGTVSDMRLMQLAMQAKNFKIPLDQLSTYLEFAHRRAKDTGASIDYLTDSIVTGLGRESPRVLDNLGISQKEIEKEFQKAGNFAVGFGNIIKNELANMPADIESSSDKIARMNATWENTKEILGGALLPIVDVLLTRLNQGLSDTGRLIESNLISKGKKWQYFFTDTGKLDELVKLEKWLGDTKDKLTELSNAGKLTDDEFKKLSQTEPFSKDQHLFSRASDELYTFYNELKDKDAFTQYKKEIDQLNTTHKLTESSLTGVINNIDKNIKGYDELIKRVKIYGESLIKNNPQGILEIIKKEIEDISRKREQATDIKSIIAYNQQLEVLNKKVTKLNEMGTKRGLLEKLDEQIKNLTEAKNKSTTLGQVQKLNIEIDKLNEKKSLIEESTKRLDQLRGKDENYNGLASVSVRPSDFNKDPYALQATSLGVMREKIEITKQKALDFENSWNSAIESVEHSFVNLGVSAAEAFGQMMGVRGKVDWAGVLLGGLGSILEEMGATLVTSGAAMMGLFAAMSNPFTSGPAMIAAGLVMAAAGAALTTFAGGGSGSSGSSTLSGSSYSVSNSAYGTNMSSAAAQQKIEVTGTIKASGKDLVLIVDRNRDTMSRER